MMLRYCVRGFASAKKPFYDAIFVGPVATLVARQFQKATGGKFLSLVINSQAKYLQPILIPTKGKPFKTHDIVHREMESCDMRIEKVLADSSKIKYADGSEIGYRQLIFTQNNELDYGNIEGLKEALDNPFSMAYSNRQGTDLSELYHVSTGDVVFSIPKGRHTGYDNYLMLHLLSKMKQRKQANSQTRVSYKMTVVNAAGKFFPYHEKLEKLYREELNKHGVEVIDNVELKKVDSNSRSVELSNGKKITFSGFYHYLALKEPTELEGINSADLNKQTIRHNKYSNITIFGNGELPTTHSYYAVNQQVNVVRENLLKSLFGDTSKAIYEGNTAIPFWKSNTQCQYFLHNYEKTLKMDGIGQNRLLGRYFAWDRRAMGQWEVETYYQFKHYGFPYYVTTPKLKTQKGVKESSPNKYTFEKKKFQ